MPLRASAGKRIVLERPSLRDRNNFNVLVTVPMIFQEQSQWCWAACTVMVKRYYGDAAVQQCHLANWLFGQSGCCSTPSSSVCNRPRPRGYGCAVYNTFALYCDSWDFPISFALIKNEIDYRRPIECIWSWTNGGGHTVIVRGYIDGTPDPYVIVNDPWYGEGTITYSSLLSAYSKGSWVGTLTNLAR